MKGKKDTILLEIADGIRVADFFESVEKARKTMEARVKETFGSHAVVWSNYARGHRLGKCVEWKIIATTTV